MIILIIIMAVIIIKATITLNIIMKVTIIQPMTIHPMIIQVTTILRMTILAMIIMTTTTTTIQHMLVMDQDAHFIKQLMEKKRPILISEQL